LRSHGCRSCGIIKTHDKQRKTTEEFINDAKEIHGPFQQTPDNHLVGQNCPECGKEIAIEKNKKRTIRRTIDNSNKSTTKEFIRKSIEKHGEKYDYSKVEYVNCKTKVIIICPIHGQFLQSPCDHLRSHGCRSCGIIKTHDKQRKTTEEFINDAKEIHGY
jgi:hypothetical protein